MATVEHPLLEADTPLLEPDAPRQDDTTSSLRRPRASSERTAIIIGGREYHWLQVLGAVLLALGVIAVVIGWFGVSGEDDVWRQMPYFVSGGIGGTCLISLGVLSLLAYEHRQDRSYVADLLRQQQELEFGLAGEFDALLQRMEDLEASNASGPRRRQVAAERSSAR